MLRPTKKMALALEAVVDIAFHGGVEPVQSLGIAERLGLPRRYLEQVMQLLVRAGILKGVRGPRGGYRLARERRRITVGEIIRVIDGAVGSVGAGDEPLGDAKVLAGVWREISDEAMSRLDQLTIEEVCSSADVPMLAGSDVRESDMSFVI